MGKIVDFSHHQGAVDWSKAKAELDLAIIRVQYGSKSIDTKYKEYIDGCKKYGIPFGLYAYARFVSVSDAITEAKDFLSRIDKDAKFLVIDVEEVTTKNPSDLVPATQAFIDYCKQNSGKKVGLYTGHAFYKEQHMDRVKADFLWIPRYGSTKPEMDCDLWQFTDKGQLAGVSANVDMSQLTGRKPFSFFIGEQEAKVQVASSTVPMQQKEDEDEMYKPSNQAIINSTAVVLSRLENKDPKSISPEWRQKLLNGELTTSDAIGLIFVALERGLIQGEKPQSA